MLKFKPRKGFVPALLTLGLVLIGSLVTIGISYLTSTNKIAPNPRAQSCTAADIPESTKACCFCQNGSVRVYATANARLVNCMGTPCTTAAYGTAYNASSWGYCDDSGSLSSYEGGTCEGGGGGGGNTPTQTPCSGSGGGCEFNCEAIGEECSCQVGDTWYKGTCKTKGKPGICTYCGGGGGGGGGAGCLNSTTTPKADPDNCTDFNSGTTIYPSHELSTKGNLIYDGKNCSGEGKSVNDAEDSFCAALNSGNCRPWDCHQVKSEWKNKDLWKNYLSGTTYYYISDDNCNSSGYTANSTDLANYCDPGAAPTSLTLTPTPYKVIYDSSHEIWKNKDYISCNKDGIRSDSLLRDSFIKDCYEGKKTVPNFEGCSYTVMQSDAGLDIYDHIYCCKIKC